MVYIKEKKEEEENEFVEGLAEAIEKAHDEGKQPGCPEGQTFGLRIALPFPYITDCGCWDEAIWPAALSFGGTKLLGSGAKRILNRVFLRRALKDAYSKGWDVVIASVRLRNRVRNVVESNIISPMNKLKKLWKALNGTDLDDLYEYITRTTNDALKKIEELGAKVGKRKFQQRDAFLDELYTNPQTREAFIAEFKSSISEIESVLNSVKTTVSGIAARLDDAGGVIGKVDVKDARRAITEINRNTDDIINDFAELVAQIDNAAVQTKTISDRLISILAYADAILSYLTVVVPKECAPLRMDEQLKTDYEGPFDPRLGGGTPERLIQAVDSIYFQGKWKGSKWDSSYFWPVLRNLKCGEADPKIAEALGDKPSWEKIRQVLIDNKLPIWPEMNADCQCVDCPEGYGLCTTTANIPLVGSDSYNICLPICGGLEVKPSLDVEAVGDTITKNNCDVGCPDGYEWVYCDSSECDKSDCKDGKDFGFCVKTPEINRRLRDNGIDPQESGPLVWDRNACKWVCRNGRYIMDWGDGDPAPPEGVSPEDWYGPVYSDDPRFDERVTIRTGTATNLGGLPGYTGTKSVPKYIFRRDRFEIELCEDNQFRIPENDCECEEIMISSGDTGEEYGLPEVPEGYILFDGNVIPIIEDSDSITIE